MSGDSPNGTLMSCLTQMLVQFMAQNTPKAACKVLKANGLDTNCDDPSWTRSKAVVESTNALASVTTQTQALQILTYVAMYGVAIPSQEIPSMRACTLDSFTTVQYSYLWTVTPGRPFCLVNLGDTVNYNPISHIVDLWTSNIPGVSDAVDIIINQYKGAISSIDPQKMKDRCHFSFSYQDMGTDPYRQLCGCYVPVPDNAGFTSDEKQFLAQNPQCNPTCLQASVAFVKGVGGTPEVCQQDVCIADNINVTGTSTTITQVCPQCPQQFQCVCYVHVNGQTLNNKACNTVYVVNDQGQITETINNTAPKPGSGLWKAFEEIIHSKWSLIILGVVALVVAITIIAILISQHLKGRTKRGPRSIPLAHREPLGNEMSSRE